MKLGKIESSRLPCSPIAMQPKHHGDGVSRHPLGYQQRTLKKSPENPSSSHCFEKPLSVCCYSSRLWRVQSSSPGHNCPVVLLAHLHRMLQMDVVGQWKHQNPRSVDRLGGSKHLIHVILVSPVETYLISTTQCLPPHHATHHLHCHCFLKAHISLPFLHHCRQCA